MKRAYTMSARARSAEATRQRVLAAAVTLLKRRMRSDIRLEDVAAEAGVSVPTVLRAYGTRAQLVDLALAQVLEGIGTELKQAEPGDVPASVAAWFDHYEKFGDAVVRNLADESDPVVAPIVRIGQTRHREHVERQLGPLMADVPDERRTMLLDALVCACDVYTWKLLRRDMGRSRADAEAAMTLMIQSLLNGG
ncbi:TetR/AcrR family transcriptional regulator [Actinomadura barringtoniae]|uniref:TetR/AcrR family transcriptional regulator n=1 Tax=Actinomadura barringtoniae TaxID=1427535 RepID=A0A939PDX2_9ACTN|nr:TetR/AcrR family transcriptional regulator [Actinomadura barringtoniae]MBO2450821.1 TetR/AcrR family transcriptional regulator [Actinomadura barringtoniae]